MRCSVANSARSGLTFIEVVVATVMLAGLASVIMGSISFMQSGNARERHRLQGMEVAHRVIAQYLDNPELLPDETLPIQQGESFYRYTFREEVLVQEDSAAKNFGRRTARNVKDLSVEEKLPQMMNRLTVHVYLDMPDNPVLDVSRPVAVLERMFNPISGRDEDVVLKSLLNMVDQMNREQADRARREADAARGSGRR